MCRKEDMDRKLKVSRSRLSKTTASLAMASRARETQDAGSPRSQSKITKATRMKFLSGGGGKLKRSPAGGSGGEPGSPNQEPACDAAPANETQLERKRRLNRNNERKKRAKRILKIEDLTARFHALTSENEALKAESKDLKEKIAEVKKFIEDQGKKPAAAVVQTQQSGFQTREGGGGSAGSTAFGALGLVLQATAPSSLSTSSATSQQPTPPPALQSVISGLTQTATRGISSPVHEGQQANPLSSTNLNMVPKEQLVRLLQVEYEKQDRIIQQLRIHAGLAEVAVASAAGALPPAVPTPTLPQAPAPTATPTAINMEEQIQAIIRRQAPPSIYLESGPAAVVVPLTATATATATPAPAPALALQLIDHLHRFGQGQCPTSTINSSLTLQPSNQAGGGDLNNLLLQQQLLLALGAIQGQNQQQHQQGQGGGGGSR